MPSKMEQSSAESTDSKVSVKNEKRLIQKVIAKLISKDENEMAKFEERLRKQVNEVEIPRRAKSVGRGTSEKGRRSSSNKAERSKSVARAEKKSELIVTTERRESSKREGETFHTNMTKMQRDNFIRENLGIKPRHSIKENLEDKMSQDRRRSGSRSRSGEKDNPGSHKRWREESGEYREYGRYRGESHAELREDSSEYRGYRQYKDKGQADPLKIKEQSRYGKHSSAERRAKSPKFMEQGHYSDHYHTDWREDRHSSLGYWDLGYQRNTEGKKETPCKYFNDVGFCKYKSDHADLCGNRKLHICAFCYYERGLKRDHGKVDCKHRSRNDCNVVEDACEHFNNGDCWHEFGGHFSRDRKYVRLHICGICFERGEKRYHPAIECKYKGSLQKYPKDSPRSERREPEPHDRNENPHKDEKPCGFFNIYGNCRYGSGHYPSSGRFTKQLHICTCCLEFRGEARNHPAIDCHLKKILVGERNKFVVENPEMPCNSFNSGNCDLKSGHRLPRGDLRVYHICKFCIEYRGEKNCHTQNECKLRKKLLREVEEESQSKCADSKKDVRREDETRNDKLEINITKETIEEKISSRFAEEPIENSKESKQTVNSKEGKQTVKVMPKVSQHDNFEESGKLKTANVIKVCLIKRKTSKATDKCSLASPCKQANPTEEAINQNVSKINEVVKHDMESLDCLIPVDKDLEEARQDASIEFDGEKVISKDANPLKTFVKNKEQESGLILSEGPSEDEHRKSNGLPPPSRKQLHHNSASETNEENGSKRRKIEKSSPQPLCKLDGASDSDDLRKSINEKEKHCEKGLLPVDDVLKSLDGEVIDHETKMDVNEILKKLEQLENLHTIEVENLRKARQLSKK